MNSKINPKTEMEQQQEKQILEHPKIKAWLEECRTPNTQRAYAMRITNFFKWYSKPVNEYLALPSGDKRHFALQYQNLGGNPNTVGSTLTALNSLLDMYDMKINFKGKKVRGRMDIDSHHFSNGDLTAMFDLGNTKEKALIALGCSLGWEINATLSLTPKQLQSYVDRAKSEGKEYFYFLSQRQKTGVPRLGVLNPLALEWVGKWLIERQTLDRRKRKEVKKSHFIVSELFDVTSDGANRILRRLAKQAHIAKTGRIHFHKLRGWVMSGLSRAQFNDFQIKFFVGKAIPSTDLTYLYGLQEQIEERYPKAYDEYLNLKAPSKAILSLSKSFEQKNKEMEVKVSQAEAEIARLREVIDTKIMGVEAWAKSQGYTGGALIIDKTPERWKKAKPKSSR